MAFFTASEIERLKSSVVLGALLVKMDFVSGPIYTWNGNTELEVNGQTYLPMYGLGRIEGVSMSREPVSERFTLTLEGLPAATVNSQGSQINVLAMALSETDEVEGQIATISLQLFDDEWQTSVGSPVALAFGFMRKPRVTRTRINGVDGPVQSVSIGAENIFYNRSLPPAGRYTDRDQQSRSDGDLICQFIPDLRSKLFLYPDY